MKPQQKTAGEIALLNFVLSHDKRKTTQIVKSNNLSLAGELIPKGYPLRVKEKGYDNTAYLPCELESLSTDKLFNI